MKAILLLTASLLLVSCSHSIQEVKPGMTMAKVKKMLGPPDKEEQHFGWRFLYYGEFVVFTGRGDSVGGIGSKTEAAALAEELVASAAQAQSDSIEAVEIAAMAKEK